jgi:DNA helicase-2/ATP-dependent DNA helicase PcrA
MRDHGIDIVAKYIGRYASELEKLTFEPEKEFETLVDYEDGHGGALISGAIDIVRQDDPPRVTLIDFKSGDPNSDKYQALAEEQMQFPVALYAVAAEKELQYQPEQGLVRYLDSSDPAKAEMRVPLDSESLQKARHAVARPAAKIRDRHFMAGLVTQSNGSLGAQPAISSVYVA